MTEGKDYIILPGGLLAFTASYLSERGYCCGSGCMNCPYNHENVPEIRKDKPVKGKPHYEKESES